MKDSEHFAIALITTLFKNKKSLLILFICSFCYIFGFKTFGSYIICNNNICQVQEKNSFGMIMSEKSINLSNIERFSYTNDYDWYYLLTHLHSKYSTTKHRVERANRFSIIVEEKNGQKYSLVKRTFKYKNSIMQTVNKLNSILEQENVNITLKL